MGFLLDEEEFQVSPAITRQVSMFEVDTLNKTRRVAIEPPRPDNFDLDLLFVSGNTQLNEVFRYTADIVIESTTNIISYSVFINNNYVGDDVDIIKITNGDTLKVDVSKSNIFDESIIKTTTYLV